MFEDVKVICENGNIKLVWKWDDNDLIGADIYYKKSTDKRDRGALFDMRGSTIPRKPGNIYGSVERPMGGEWGLYTFTFVGIGRSKVKPEVEVPNVMLGKKLDVFWRLEIQKEGVVIVFPNCSKTIPEGVIRVEYDGCYMDLKYPVSSNTKLMLLKKNNTSEYKLQVKEPYDRAYNLIQC
ncbi:MAG: hypothetical protein K2L07_11595 [Lachnospiraceae bacterium]|nr:hypothetical protein [Lachnospiraceae bacterium]